MSTPTEASSNIHQHHQKAEALLREMLPADFPVGFDTCAISVQVVPHHWPQEKSAHYRMISTMYCLNEDGTWWKLEDRLGEVETMEEAVLDFALILLQKYSGGEG